MVPSGPSGSLALSGVKGEVQERGILMWPGLRRKSLVGVHPKIGAGSTNGSIWNVALVAERMTLKSPVCVQNAVDYRHVVTPRSELRKAVGLCSNTLNVGRACPL